MKSYEEVLDIVVSRRKAAGLKQKDIADSCDVRSSTVSNWEQGLARIPFHHLLTILGMLDLDLAVVDHTTAAGLEAARILGEVQDERLRGLILQLVADGAGLDEGALLDVLAITERLKVRGEHYAKTKLAN